MLIYDVILIVMVSLVIIFSISYKKASWISKKFLPIVAMLSLSIVSGLRDYSVGTDTRIYVERYSSIGNTDWMDLFYISDFYKFEYGFSAICKMLYLINDDYSLLLFFTSLWIGLLYYICINEYSKYPLLSILIFYCWGFWASSMNIVRQMMIIPLLYISIGSAVRREFKKFILVVVIASFIHTSALVFIPIYFLINKKIDIKFIWLTICFTLLVLFWGNDILSSLLASTGYSIYFHSYQTASGLNTLILLILILVLSFILRKRLEVIDKNINVWILLIVISIISTAMAIQIPPIERITKIFITSIMFLFTDLYLLVKNYNFRFSSLILLILMLTYYYYGIIMDTVHSSSGTIPYETWWK